MCESVAKLPCGEVTGNPLVGGSTQSAQESTKNDSSCCTNDRDST